MNHAPPGIQTNTQGMRGQLEQATGSPTSHSATTAGGVLVTKQSAISLQSPGPGEASGAPEIRGEEKGALDVTLLPGRIVRFFESTTVTVGSKLHPAALPTGGIEHGGSLGRKAFRSECSSNGVDKTR
jgi:hypothetical protein